MKPDDITTERPAGLLDQILAAAEPKHKEFEIELPGGNKLKFRADIKFPEFQSIKAGAGVFIKAVTKAGVPAQFSEFRIKDPETLALCYTFAKTGVDGLSEFEYMKLAFMNPSLFGFITRTYNEIGGKFAGDAEDEAVDDAKKDSETSTTETG